MKKFKIAGQDEKVKMKLSHFGTIEERHVNVLNTIVEQGDCNLISCHRSHCPFSNFGDDGISRVEWWCGVKQVPEMAKRLLKLIDKENNNGK